MDDSLEMDEVTIELEDETLERVDTLAFENHRGNRAAALRTLLDEWLKSDE